MTNIDSVPAGLECPDAPLGRVLAGAAVALVTRAIAEQSSEPGERRQQRPLHRTWRRCQVHLVRVLAGEDGELQESRLTVPVDLAVTREADRRLVEGLPPERRPHLEKHADRLPSGAPEPVRDARRNDRHVAGVQPAITALDRDPERA